MKRPNRIHTHPLSDSSILARFQVNDELMRQDLPKALESAGRLDTNRTVTPGVSARRGDCTV